MIRLTAFAATAALLLTVATTSSVLRSEARSPNFAIDLCAHAEAETATQGACTPSSLGGAPQTPTETVLLGACAGGDLHLIRYDSNAGQPLVASWCGSSP